MQTVLVTGGAGHIGASFVKKLLAAQLYKVIVIDNLLTGSKSYLPENHDLLTFIEADINEEASYRSAIENFNIDYLFHFAAVVGVARTLQNPLLVLKDIEGIKNVLELARNQNCKKVYYTSSSEVYGESVSFPQMEHETPLSANLPYAVVKKIGENYFKAYQQEYNLQFTIFRLFNTYGSLQSKDFVISKFLDAALANKPITIYGDGAQTRTFCHISDTIETMYLVFEKNAFNNDIINIGNNVETSMLDLANLVKKACNSSAELLHLPPLMEGDMTRRCPDNSKMKGILNRPLIDLETGLQLILKENNLA